MITKTESGSLATRLVIFILALVTGIFALPSQGRAAVPESVEPTVEFDRDGDGRTGEATAIRKRTRHYLESREVDGKYTSADALARARWGYDRWLEEGRQRLKNGIEGNGWVSIGPDNGAGRSVVVVPHPTNTGELLTGTAGGGLWRTRDGGLSWTALTDGIPDLSAGAAAYAPQNPDIIYLGTGEGGYGGDFIPGIGLLRSDDGGETWFMPQSPSEILATQFFSISVKHPAGSDVTDPATYEVLAATNEGLFRSLDGGENWDLVIGSNSLVGVSQVIRPDVDQDPDLVYSALWCSRSCPTGTARIMKSVDSGLTWSPSATGLPPTTNNSSRNRNALTSTADGQTLYAGLNTSADAGDSPEAKIFRSDDGGASWYQTGNTGVYLGSQGWYDNTITVHPTNPEIVIGGGVWYVVSSNGGTSWQTKNPYAGTPNLPHVDAHDLQWQGDTLWVASDGGMWSSINFGSTYTDRNDSLVTRQYYAMGLDPINRERVIGGTQDNGTDLRDLSGDNSWNDVIGGDGFGCAINSLVPDFMYGSVYDTRIFRSTDGGSAWSEMGPYVEEDETPFATPLNMNWSKPWILYTGSERVWKTDNAGDSWANLSKVVENGEWKDDVLVRAIASTPADPAMIMVATKSNVYTSHNSGESWYGTLLGSTVNTVAVSPFDPDLAIACKSGTSIGLGSVFLTHDGGVNWQWGGYGLPPFAIHSAVWDPIDENIIYAGTDVGLYRSVDGGINWSVIGDGLPAVSIHDVEVLPDGSMLRVATHGRGMWELQINEVSNVAPTVEITSPTASFSGTAGDRLQFSATVSDPDGDEVSLQWIVTDLWNVYPGETGTGSFDSSTEIDLLTGGRYEVIAHVTDNKGGAAFDRIAGLVFEPADECATPQLIPSSGPFPVTVITSNETASHQTSDPNVWCITDPNTPNAGSEASLWFEFTPAETNNYQISTCNSQSDTVLSVWTGDSCGPYTQVSGGCNDDDEMVHCAGHRTDSYLDLDLTAGTTYRIMLGAYQSGSEGRVRLHVECGTCETTIPGRHYIVPAAAHAAGNNDTMWLTDLDLFNATDIDTIADISFLPAGGDNSSSQTYPVTIGAGTAQSYSDVVASLLETSGSGAISIIASQAILIASRTYNNAAEGTFGQFIPGVETETAIPAGASVRLIGLAGNDAFRTNIGVSNTSKAAASVAIDLYDATGVLLATRPETLEAMGWLQVTDIFAKEGISDIEAASAVVRNTSAEASIVTYASIVDEITGDPTYVTTADTATATSPVIIAASAHADGSGTSVWRTDLELANVSADNLIATIEVLLKNEDNSSPVSITHEISAGTNLRIGDVLATDFAINGSAALRISVNQGALMATSRTYNQTDAGTYGQFIPGVYESDAIQTGERGVLIQLRQQTGEFRTNVGLVNLAGSQVLVDANFYDNDGGYIGYAQYTLQPYEYDQANEAFPGGAQTEGGFVVLSTETAGAEFLAYASVIDSGSDDPVYIPATIYE